MIDRDKYVVMKRDDFERRMSALLLEVDESIVQDIRSQALQDAVVIRKKDTFAPSALYTYATSVLTALDVMQDAGRLTDAERGRLQELADFFAGEADHARQIAGRIPD